MNLKIPYVLVKQQSDAFEVVEQFLNSEGLSIMPVKPKFQFLKDKNLIIAEGSGYKIKANFEMTAVNIDIELSFLYKAFGNKIKSILENHLKQKL